MRLVLEIQGEINQEAHRLGRPCVDLVNAEEHARILALIDAKTWPQGWTGNERLGDILLDQVVADGVLQPLLLRGAE